MHHDLNHVEGDRAVGSVADLKRARHGSTEQLTRGSERTHPLGRNDGHEYPVHEEGATFPLGIAASTPRRRANALNATSTMMTARHTSETPCTLSLLAIAQSSRPVSTSIASPGNARKLIDVASVDATPAARSRDQGGCTVHVAGDGHGVTHPVVMSRAYPGSVVLARNAGEDGRLRRIHVTVS